MKRPPEPSVSPSPEPKPAASLILVREEFGALQVYLLRRSLSSGFMPGYFVFPGGMVDAWDRDESVWRIRMDLTPQAFQEKLAAGFGQDDCLAHAVAAIRETYEEAGVILARVPDAPDGGLERLADRRRSGNLGRGWMARQASSAGLALKVSALSAWARWITPVGMARRFNTPFFLAVTPKDQQCSPDFRETTEGIWVRPLDALVKNLSGEIPLSPPTLVTLQELSGYPDMASLQPGLHTRRWGRPILPRLISLGEDGGAVIIEPWDPYYSLENCQVDVQKLKRNMLPVGEAFSRLWNRDGIWRPVS